MARKADSNESLLNTYGYNTENQMAETLPIRRDGSYNIGLSRANFNYAYEPSLQYFLTNSFKLGGLVNVNAIDVLKSQFNVIPSPNEDIFSKTLSGLITGVDFVPKMNSYMPVVALKKSSSELGMDIVTPDNFSWSNNTGCRIVFCGSFAIFSKIYYPSPSSSFL